MQVNTHTNNTVSTPTPMSASLHVIVQARTQACMLVPMTEPYTLAVAMQKGGVGKTTTAINLGYELAQAGYRTLVIDLDPQGNTTSGFGVTIGDDDGTMFEALTPEKDVRMPLSEVIQTTDFGVDVAPADESLRKLENSGLGPGGENRLRVALSTLDPGYDIVVIDCPPALGPMTTSALAAATDVLAVVGSNGPDELTALSRLTETVYEAQELLNPGVDVRHVLLANHKGGSALSKGIRLNLVKDWPDEYLGEISRTVRVGEAKDRRVPVAVYAPSSTAAEDYHAAAAQIINRITADA